MDRTLRRASLIVSALFAAACGSSTSPLTPAPAAVPITPTVITLSGHATATSSRQALGGLAVDFGGRRTETDGAGNFQYQLASNAVARLVLTGSAIVPRSVLVSVAVSRDLNVDAIALAGFDLTFYRQLVRNGTETPTGLEPLRRWTENPQFYLRTVDDAGTALDIQTLDRTEAVIRETVPIWTNRTFPGSVERGTSTKDGVRGWITIYWQSSHNASGTQCGDSLIGANPGRINLEYAGLCRCAGTEIRPHVVRHELGHAMGFWHTDSDRDTMFPTTAVCDQLPSARERAAAAIAYARPVGNVDPDTDSDRTVSLTPMVVR